MSIQVNNITKLYGSQSAVDNVSFFIPRGQTCGFLGPNGAGKSTTLKIITGFLQANSGQVLVDDINVSQHPIEAKKNIGYLAEHNPLYKNLYVKEFLRFIASLHHIENKKEAIDRTIVQTGLEKESHKQIRQLSKGYRQRVGLAQALINNPKILILDEPLSGLDPNQLEELRHLIKQLGKEKTVIFSSHILQEVEQVANRIIMINDGKIVMDEMQENSTSAGKYTLVQFAEKLPEDLETKLHVQFETSFDGNYYLIEGSSEEQRKQLFFFAKENNLTLLRLEQRQEELTQIFKQKTKN